MEFKKKNAVSLTIIGVFAVNIMILGCVYLSYNLLQQKEIIESQDNELKELRQGLQKMELLEQESLKVVEEAERLNGAIAVVEEEKQELEQEIVSLQDELAAREENIRIQQEHYEKLERKFHEQEKEVRQREMEREITPRSIN